MGRPADETVTAPWLLLVVILAGIGATYVGCPGCIDRHRVNKTCEWKRAYEQLPSRDMEPMESAASWRGARRASYCSGSSPCFTIGSAGTRNALATFPLRKAF